MASSRITLWLAISLSGAAWAQAPAPPTPPPAARAPMQATADSVKVSLWPEYDRQALLVMIEAKLPAGAPNPARLRLPMPAAAGKPHAVAQRDPEGKLLLAQYDMKVEGEWAWLDITTQHGNARLEYYAPLATDQPERRYTFKWPGGMAVGNLHFEVQRPIKASDLTVTPKAASETTDRAGLTYAHGDVGGLAPGQAAQIELRYRMEQPELTMAVLQRRQGPAPAEPSAADPVTPSTSSTLTTPPIPHRGADWVLYLPPAIVVLVVIWLLLRRRDPAG